MKVKPEKNSGLSRIQTHDLCNTGVVYYELSYQLTLTGWGSCFELIMYENMKVHIFELQWKIFKTWEIIAAVYIA